MRLDNGNISERQNFRMGILENITLGIIVVPYICTSNAGGWHYMAFALGLIFTFVYSFIIYFYSKAFPQGMIEEMDELLGRGGRVIDIVYVLRYIIKASLIILFASFVLREYMLRSFNLWIIIISFTVICGYGASRDIEKRGRLIELLFWWMIVPLILVAVFSVSNVNWQIKGITGSVDYEKIFMGGYQMLIVMSSLETMLFTLTKVKKGGWSNYLKTIIWILVSVLFSYIFVQGVIGEKWAKKSSMSVLYVMEAARFPGGIERMDYAVVAFLLIGIFSVVSGYMFYAKEFLRVTFSKRWNTFEKNENGTINNNFVEEVSDKWWTIVLVMILTVGGVWLWSLYDISDILYYYLLWFDIGISLIVPLFLLFVKLIKTKRMSGAGLKKERPAFGIQKRIINMVIVFLLCEIFLSGCMNRVRFERIDDRQSSLETMDYAVVLSVKNDESTAEAFDDTFSFVFEIADLSDYKGDSEDLLLTSDYTCEAVSLDKALNKYYTEKDKHVDLGHLKMIKLYCGEISRKDKMNGNDLTNKKIVDVIDELKNLPSINKSVDVEVYSISGVRKIKLRNLIKNLYEGEEF